MCSDRYSNVHLNCGDVNINNKQINLRRRSSPSGPFLILKVVCDEGVEKDGLEELPVAHMRLPVHLVNSVRCNHQFTVASSIACLLPISLRIVTHT
jgi:hypothetical protein